VDAYAAMLVPGTLTIADGSRQSHDDPAGTTPVARYISRRQLQFQQDLQDRLAQDKELAPEEISPERIENHFRLLQATDNLSLLSCVDFPRSADLLHALPLREGGAHRHCGRIAG